MQTAIPAILIDPDGGELSVEVVDLSRGGFRLRADEAMVEGEEVRLRVSRYGDFTARIQWARGLEAGGVFLDPVTL